MAAISLLVLFGCGENKVFEDHHSPPNDLEWNRNEIISFDIQIIDTSIKYDVTIALRYAAGYAYPFCNVIVSEISPSGEKSDREFRIKTMDSEGYRGDAAGDIFDLEELYSENRSFGEKGIWHFELKHGMPEDKIHMIMELGMIVEKHTAE